MLMDWVAALCLVFALHIIMSATMTITEQIKMLENVCKVEEFKNAIQKSGYKGFSITRKIALFTLKHRLYILTMYIGKIRQNQFKHRRKK